MSDGDHDESSGLLGITRRFAVERGRESGFPDPVLAATIYYAALRLELTLADDYQRLGPEAAVSIGLEPYDPVTFFTFLRRADTAWREAGEPSLPDRDFVMERVQDGVVS